MRSKIITIADNPASTESSQIVINSSAKVKNDFTPEIFGAVTPETVDSKMSEYRLRWNYPWGGEEYDILSGLKKTAYTTANPEKRIACFLSHYTLWKESAESEESILILEHDALFTAKVDVEMLEKSRYSIIGLNDPRGATRRAGMFHQYVQDRNKGVVPCPKIDMDHVPQGLAGNSAYYIKPEGAKKMLWLVKEFGAWPNDAIMCRQLLGGRLGVSNPYFTKVQGTRSTTTL
jgi:GR25 family glycosyltransferase involved in LPS biosynthesis